MTIRAIDHVYAETTRWGAAVAFWKGLGFEFAERWGSEGHRAGRLVSGDAVVVVAEVPAGTEPGFSVFFATDDVDGLRPGEAVEVVTPPEDTHWGTRWLRAADPEGRVYSIEGPAGTGEA
jgi:catechol 2,3-dioxygenase-like lactoylglutathione lyase family enzyme